MFTLPHHRSVCPHRMYSLKISSLRTIALSSQKDILAQVRKWPLESGREDRSLKHPLLLRLERDLELMRDTDDRMELVALANKSKEEYKAVTDLIEGNYFKKHKLENYIVPNMVSKQEKFLSSKAQAKIKQRKWGFLDRFFTWYFDDEPKKSPYGDFGKKKKIKKKLEFNKKKKKKKKKKSTLR
eukprot:TRINITY_DN9257_c0_g1_i1.p1 TRINITY_DN9257_c0_g1~~TRINITY_DN9257_c0_g1_i1.p1  ORF type:complete len:184 (-),score=38.13 TRINITY_DN9257_c0_g1_i1:36-587(-)